MPCIKYEEAHKRVELAPEGTAWDAAKVRKELPNDPAVLMKVHAWTYKKNSDIKGHYKLPHHLSDGRLVWKGVVAAYAALKGARGGVEIPKEDYNCVLEHILRHYEDFGRPRPEGEGKKVLTYRKFLKGSVSAKVQDVDVKNRQVAGYFAVFDKVDSDGEFFTKGAFQKSIKENKHRIKHLWNHRTDIPPIAKIEVLEEDNYGLFFISKFFDKGLSAEIFELYKEGVITEHSVGFFVLKNSFDKDRNAVALEDVWLMEGSSVLWGANEFTKVVCVGSCSAGKGKETNILEKNKKCCEKKRIIENLSTFYELKKLINKF